MDDAISILSTGNSSYDKDYDNPYWKKDPEGGFLPPKFVKVCMAFSVEAVFLALSYKNI